MAVRRLAPHTTHDNVLTSLTGYPRTNRRTNGSPWETRFIRFSVPGTKSARRTSCRVKLEPGRHVTIGTAQGTYRRPTSQDWKFAFLRPHDPNFCSDEPLPRRGTSISSR